MRVNNLDKTLRLWVCRMAWTTLGTSFNTNGLRIGCLEKKFCDIRNGNETSAVTNRKVRVVKLFAFLLLGTFQSESVNFI